METYNAQVSVRAAHCATTGNMIMKHIAYNTEKYTIYTTSNQQKQYYTDVFLTKT